MILLDIHGVLLDLQTALNCPRDQYGPLPKKLDKTPSFWINTPKYPWYHDLLDLVHSFDNVTLCTKPSKYNAGAMSKWIQKNLPNTPYIITAEKHLCHGVLIDDLRI